MSYYKDQLNKLQKSEYFKTIVLSDGLGNKTKYMDLNSESIPSLIEFLKMELSSVNKHKPLSLNIDSIIRFNTNMANPYVEHTTEHHIYLDLSNDENSQLVSISKLMRTNDLPFSYYSQGLPKLTNDGLVELVG